VRKDTIEEIQILFSQGGPKPCKTKTGDSPIDAEIVAVLERKTHGETGYVHRLGESPDIHSAAGVNAEEKGTMPTMIDRIE
jgi:hypothetical protein